MQDKKKSKDRLIQELVESRQAESALREILLNMDDLVFVLDRNNQIVSFHAPEKRLYLKPSEFLGKPHSEIIPSEVNELFKVALVDVKNGQVGGYEYSLEMPDGERWYSAKLSPLFKNNEYDGLIAVVRDVTLSAFEHLRFKNILDSINAIVYVSDLDSYELLFMNKYALNVFDKSEADIGGTKCYSILQAGQKGPCDFCTNHLLLGKNNRPNKPHVRDFQNTVTGSWFHCSDQAIRWEDGKLVRLEIATDISELKQYEEAILTSESKWRTLSENSPDHIMLLDSDFNITFINYSAPGLDEDIVEGTSIFDYLKANNRQLVKTCLEGVLETGNADKYETEYHASKSEIRYHSSKVNSIGQGNNVSGLIVTTSDTTDDKRHENLINSQLELAQMLNDVTSLDHALKITMDAVLKYTILDSGGIYLMDEAEDGFRLVHSEGLGSDFIQTTSYFKSDSDQYRLVMQGEPIFLEYSKIGIKLNKVEKAEGLKLLAVFPIIHRGTVLGCLNGASHTQSTLPEPEQNIFGTTAHQLGNVVARLKTTEKLNQSELLYRNLVETTSAIGWEVDIASLKFNYIGPQIVDLTGYPQEDWVDFDFWAGKILAEDRDAAVKYCNQKTMAGLNHAFEYRILTADKTVKWIRDVVTVVEENGKPITLRGFFLDITDQKANEIALKDSELLLRESQRIAQIGSYILDLSNSTWQSSKSLDQILGIEQDHPHDIQSWIEFIHPDDKSVIENYLNQNVFDQHEVFDMEFRINQISSGKSVWVHGLGDLEFDQSGKPIKLIGTVQDITQRKYHDMTQEFQRDLALGISIAVNLQQGLNAILTELFMLDEFDAGGIYLIDQHTGDWNLTHHLGLPNEFVENVSHYDADAARFQPIMKRKLISFSVDEAPQNIRSELEMDDIIGLTIVPLFFGANMIGSINLASHTHTSVSEFSKSVLNSISSIELGAAIEKMVSEEMLRNSILEKDSLIGEIQIQSRDLSLINKINTMVNSDKSLVDIAKLLTKECKDLYGSHECRIYLSDKKNENIHLPTINISSKYLKVIQDLVGVDFQLPKISIPITPENMVHELLNAEKPVLIDNPENIEAWLLEVAESSTFPKHLKKLLSRYVSKIRKIMGIKNILSVALYKRNKPIGLFNMMSGNDFAPNAKSRFAILGAHLSIAIQRFDSRNKLLQSLDEKEVLIREIHHRVKNNMQVIVSLMRMHTRRAKAPELEKIFTDFQDRVGAMSLIHEALYQSDNLSHIDFEGYLKKLCRNLSQVYGATGKGIELRVAKSNVSLNMDQGIAVGMLISELISNAFKHAFPDDKGGFVHVELADLGEANVRLIVEDNGVGIPKDIDINAPASLGLRLAMATAKRELGGNVTLDTDNGTRFTIHFNGEGI